MFRMIQQFINREVINKIYSNINNQFKKYMYDHRLQKKSIYIYKRGEFRVMSVLIHVSNEIRYKKRKCC